MKNLTDRIRQVIIGCQRYAISIFITYCISCSIGMWMSQGINEMALAYGDKIVGKAIKNVYASLNYQKGNRFTAAAIDCSGNL